VREVPGMNFQENSSHESRHKAENVYDWLVGIKLTSRVGNVRVVT